MKKSFYICSALASPSGEMVDTLVSGASASRHVGSSPISGTLDSAFAGSSFLLIKNRYEDRFSGCSDNGRCVV